MPPQSTHLADYPVVIAIPVAWGEMDSYAHVNNAVYFRWFESARIAYFDRIGFRLPADNHGVAPILAATQCRFRKPLTYPDTVLVGARVTELSHDRFQMTYRVVSQIDDGLAAEGTGSVVAYNYGVGIKAALPDAVVERIRALENDQLTGPPNILPRNSM